MSIGSLHHFLDHRVPAVEGKQAVVVPGLRSLQPDPPLCQRFQIEFKKRFLVRDTVLIRQSRKEKVRKVAKSVSRKHHLPVIVTGTSVRVRKGDVFWIRTSRPFVLSPFGSDE